MRLENKKVAITGAGRGIGRSIALALAAEGAELAVTDLNPEWAKTVTEEIRVVGGKAVDYELNVTDRDEVESTVGRIWEHMGRIDVWCNNAGVSSMRRFLELTDRDWDFNMNVNARGVFLCTQAVLRRILKQEPDPATALRGKIINTASMAGKRGNAPFLAHYVASKFAVVGLTRAVAGEFAAQGVTVNAVCPGYVKTGMQDREAEWEAQLRADGTTAEDVRRLYIEDTPLGRIETSQDVAGVVVFLASKDADFVTGEAINVNGGAWMD
jgi:NAD(P)-dependent dehydrogenase (short-subunit alcohol dehydrogenase family)